MAEIHSGSWQQTPESFRQDLHPNPAAGINYGTQGPHKEVGARTAYDAKQAHARLQEFYDDELKQIPVLPEGSRLEQGATYVNLRGPEPHEWTARAEQVTGDGDLVVPKAAVPYPIWNRLLGVRDPERLNRA